MTTNQKLNSVNVRMYRQGFGDCFLISFQYKDSSEEKHIMIDFGVLMGSGGEAKMESIAENILSRTGGQINCLAVTHEHWDHFSGFKKKQAKEAIAKLKFENLWLAWTEEKDNESAIALRNRKKAVQNNISTGLKQLKSDLKGLKANKSNDRIKEAFNRRMNNIEHLLKFEGGELDLNGASDSGNKSKEKGDGDGLMKILSDVWDNLNSKTIFHKPGDIINLDWEGVRVYVLGPPYQWDYLRKNESNEYGELYLSEKILELPTDISFNNPNTFMNSYLFADEGRKERWSDKNIPFDEHWALYNINKETEEIKLYPLENQALRESEQKRIIDNIMESDVFQAYTSGNDIRRIDHDYLSYIEPLAMKLNSHTNNTSLVLAIELIDSGKVLLFPGDAQYGNWLSWTDKKLEWEIPLKDGKKEKVSVEDLLARTVFYKVSHHCSHNGTPQERGLELMKEKNLIVAIPVNETDAKGKGWDRIPYEHIMNRLKQKVKTVNGKPAILRSDANFASSYAKDDEIQGDENELYFDIKIKNE